MTGTQSIAMGTMQKLQALNRYTPSTMKYLALIAMERGTIHSSTSPKNQYGAEINCEIEKDLD